MKKNSHYNFPPSRFPDWDGKPTMVIDSMGLAHAAKHTYAKLSHAGSSTAMIYGVPQMVKKLIHEHKPGKVIMCWDGERDPKRIEILPTYKCHREKKDPKFVKQLEKVRLLMYRLGIAQAHSEALEGDDMVYKVVKHEQLLNKVIIVSGDKDMAQMINRDVKIWNHRTSSPMSHHTFHIDYGCEANQFIDYLCLRGDKSDDIPGMHGIGAVKAKNFLDKYGSIKEYLKNKKADWPGMSDKESVKKIWLRNRAIINLEYFDRKFNQDKPIEWFKGKKNPTLNPEKLRLLCYKYNLKTYLDPKFQKFFTDL